MTAIAFCDFEEHKTLVPPEHFESNHFFVKLVHGVQVPDADGNFAESFDPAADLFMTSPLRGFTYIDIITDFDYPPSRAKPSVGSQHGG